jgi:hypothetical protein
MLRPDIDKHSSFPAGTDPLPILQDACTFLARLPRFHLVVRETIDDPAAFLNRKRRKALRRLSVARPDCLLADFRGDAVNKRLWYDGRTLTILDRDCGLCGRVVVPNSIEGMLDFVDEQFGMVFPLGSLLRRDAYHTISSQVCGMKHVGVERIDQHDCHHLVFTQRTMDLELWIRARACPLIRSLSIRYKALPGQPCYSARIVGWNVRPRLARQLFEFQPGPGLTCIGMAGSSDSSHELAVARARVLGIFRAL